MLTNRIRTAGWFVTGAMLATAITVTTLNAWRVDAAPGADDATLVPITPCRLEDTRQPGRAKLQPGEVRTIEAHGTNGPVAGSQCTIPDDAVGLSMNVTALEASAGTFWTIWASGEPQPEASSLNPSPGQPPTPNAVNTPISSSGEFNVFNAQGAVGMLIDVNGYYTRSSLQELASRLTAVEADVAANTADIATNATDIATLVAREPFTATTRSSFTSVGDTVETVLTLNLRAQAAGHVTVVFTTTASNGTPGEIITCSINDSEAFDSDYQQQWESPGLDGGDAVMAGSRVFEIGAGQSGRYWLVCITAAMGSATLNDTIMTAIFTPTG